jgi:hypothetical protein
VLLLLHGKSNPLVYKFVCLPADANRVTQQQPSGEVKERYKQGFKQLAYRLALGKELLPDSLHSGILLLQVDGEIQPCCEDASLSSFDMETLQQYPGVGQFSFTPIIRRQHAGAAVDRDSEDDLQLLLYDALSLGVSGSACILRDSPFPLSDEDGEPTRPELQDVLDVVSFTCIGVRRRNFGKTTSASSDLRSNSSSCVHRCRDPGA